jgi:hypothetical protein
MNERDAEKCFMKISSKKNKNITFAKVKRIKLWKQKLWKRQQKKYRTKQRKNQK